jgi:pimeloyl-ACP methyl ester carboxylesterase
VVVNGVRLHYTDWGGQGESLLFLTPLGGDLHEQFDSLAPQFIDRFHVMGLTRRGQDPSEKPETGYDQDTLVTDIVGFLDAMGIQRTHVAAHSIGGAEMTRLATTHPTRVASLVYLDAVVDYRTLGQIATEAGLDPPADPALAAILRGAGERTPDYTAIQAPALNIEVVFEGKIPVHPNDDTPAYRRYLQIVEERDFVGAQIRQFAGEMARGETLMLRNTTHGDFLMDPEQQKVFVPVMKEFLSRR